MQVEIWSDIVCPWCAVGKARFETALASFPHRDAVTLRWRSFELDPSAPRVVEGDYAQRLADKYGTGLPGARQMIEQMTATAAEEGLEFRFDRVRPGNTFDAHRLLHLAADRGLQHDLKARLLAGYLTEGEPIGEHEALQRLAVQAGLDEVEVKEVLAADRYADAVRADERQAYAFGINAVPFFVIDRRVGVPGAQPADVLLGVLEEAWRSSVGLTVVGDQDGGDACADGACAV